MSVSFQPTRRAIGLAALIAATAAGAATAAEVEVETVVLRLLDEANVPAQESGVLSELNVREGSRVQRGDSLGQIDDRVARLEEQTARTELQAAQAELANDVSSRFAAKAHEVAKAELARSDNSVRTFSGSVSESQLDVERLNVEKTALEHEQAQHEQNLQQFEVELKRQAHAASKLQVRRRRITAPLSGTVVEVFVRPGEWIEPGQKALRIVSTDTLKAEGFVDAADAPSSLQGTKIRLSVPSADTGADPADKSYPGNIAFVSPEIDPITNQVRIWAKIKNPQGKLRPGQRVRMWISPP